MFEHSGGVGGVELTTTLEPFLNMEPYAAPSLVCKLRGYVNVDNSGKTVFTKDTFECFDPR